MTSSTPHWCSTISRFWSTVTAWWWHWKWFYSKQRQWLAMPWGYFCINALQSNPGNTFLSMTLIKPRRTNLYLCPGGQYQLCFGTGHTRRIPRLSSSLPNKVILMMKCLKVDEDSRSWGWSFLRCRYDEATMPDFSQYYNCSPDDALC